MRCLVTAGPTFEPLDQVRRLTNFSTGRLGSELASFLAGKGHEVLLLIGEQATYAGQQRARRIETFTTTASLEERLRKLAVQPWDALFHTAAVSDFAFGKIWRRQERGKLEEVKENPGKLSTRRGTLLAELAPTPKILPQLRNWYPQARITGWKYEVEGGRAAALRTARQQLRECGTSACVLNGPAYGSGFALLGSKPGFRHLATAPALFRALERMLREA